MIRLRLGTASAREDPVDADDDRRDASDRGR